MDEPPIAPRFGRIAEGPPPPAPSGESFATLLAGAGGARVERIASRALAPPRDDAPPGEDSPGHWYDQATEEFVLLLEGAARLGFADGTERRLGPGDWVVLPAGCRHRVVWTDPLAVTLWLAVHLPPAAHPPD